MRRMAFIAIVVSGCAAAQTKGASEPQPAFVFTPVHGTPSTGRFSPAGPVSFIDQFDGAAYSIDLRKVEKIEISVRKGAEATRCGSASKVVITFEDGTRQHGCFAAGPLAFMGDPGSIPSVSAVSGKFIRLKQKR